MHKLGEFIQELTDTRGMTRSDLVKASDLSRQHVRQLITRETLGRMPEETTFRALARAFPGVSEETVIWRAAEPTGVQVDRLTVVSPALDEIRNEALLQELARRLDAMPVADGDPAAALATVEPGLAQETGAHDVGTAGPHVTGDELGASREQDQAGEENQDRPD